jgi:hypothetical protein
MVLQNSKWKEKLDSGDGIQTRDMLNFLGKPISHHF